VLNRRDIKKSVCHLINATAQAVGGRSMFEIRKENKRLFGHNNPHNNHRREYVGGLDRGHKLLGDFNALTNIILTFPL
jgi:hypothetical protein